MGRASKLALVAGLASVSIALALAIPASPPAAGASASPQARADAPSARTNIPGHCRSATAPDPICDAAWAASRRRFFGQQDENR